MKRQIILIAVILFMAAFALRAWNLDSSRSDPASPPGWRDDELSNAFVVSPLVMKGDIRLYYSHASGHEGLYHLLHAPFIQAFGSGYVGIRGLSVVLGALSVAMTFLAGREIFGTWAALIAALAMLPSFWSLMYSRSGQRHILLLPVTLAAFWAFWRACEFHSAPLTPALPPASKGKGKMRYFVLAGGLFGVNFYTYFVARGVPLIPAALAVHAAIFHREKLRQNARGLALMFAITAALAAPLFIAIAGEPGAETRIAELAVPIYALRDGDPSLLITYTARTAGMFAFTGDNEALYNLPYRPIFGPLGALLFFAGVLLALRRIKKPAYAFLLLWLGAGMAPGALSVPAASLGHTILAMPAAYLLMALPLSAVWQAVKEMPRRRWAALALIAAALVWEGARNLHDYFIAWPADGYVQVLHHTPVVDGARWLEANDAPQDVIFGSFIVERWDQVSFDLSVQRPEAWRVRWFDPRTSYIWPEGDGVAILPQYLNPPDALADLYAESLHATGTFRAYGGAEVLPHGEPFAAFERGLDWVGVSMDGKTLETLWRVREPLDLPDRPLIAKPPALEESATPRLYVFALLLPTDSEEPAAAVGGLGVDPYTLQVGDVFMQRLTFPDAPPGPYRIAVGLYDPHTGTRWKAAGGEDVVVWREEVTIP